MLVELTCIHTGILHSQQLLACITTTMQLVFFISAPVYIYSLPTPTHCDSVYTVCVCVCVKQYTYSSLHDVVRN